MKKLLLQLSLAAACVALSPLGAQNPPADVDFFRGLNLVDAKFSDPTIWTEYNVGVNQWEAMSITVNPWELPIAATNQVRLKFDASTIFSDTVIGSFDNPLNIRLEGLYNTTFNITADFHIAGGISQDGGSYVNIYNGAKVSMGSGIGNIAGVHVYGSGTELTFKNGSSSRGDFKVSNGAVIKMLNGQSLSVDQDTAVLSLENAAIYGQIHTCNGGTTSLKNSKFYGGYKNESITAGGAMNFTMDNSEFFLYYTGWDTVSTDGDNFARWRGNVLFLGLGGGAQQNFTFKNGTVIHGGGASDGTSFWDMDPATRVRADIADGGGFNLGWNAYAIGSDFLDVNFESGTKVAARSVDLGNNVSPQSSLGRITWTQSGTNATNGYTEVYLGGDFNLRGSTAAVAPDANTYDASANMAGFSRLEAWNMHIAENGMTGGRASFNITGSNNTLVTDSNISMGGNMSGGEAAFNIAGENNEISVQNDMNIGNNGMSGGKALFSFGGKNNAINVANNINLGASSAMTGGDITFSLTGEGNSLTAGKIRISEGEDKDAAMAGNVSFYAKGSNASNKNTIVITSSELLLQGSQAAGSAYTNSFTLDGNTVLRGADDKGVWLKINEWGGKNYTSNVKFTVSGTGNDVLFSGLEIGKDTTTGGGTSTFEVVGGGSTILIANNNDNRNGFKLQKGGVLSYKINDTGISTIKNATWNNATFEGNLEVDLRGLTGKADNERFVLFATVDPTLHEDGRMNLWFDFSNLDLLIELGDFIKVLLRDQNQDVYHFALETYNDAEMGGKVQALVLYYTSQVPEPAAFAAILGLLAFVVAFKNRKQRS